MATYTIDENRRWAYSFDVATLKRIVVIAKDFSEADPEITVKLRNKHSIVDVSLDAIVAQHAINGQAVRTLTIVSYARDRVFKFEANQSVLLDAVEYTIRSAEQSRASDAARQLEHELDGAAVWYGWIYWFGPWFSMVVGFLPAIYGTAFRFVSGREVGAFEGIVTLVLLALALIFRFFLSTSVEFVLGKGAKLARARTVAQVFVFATFVVGIVIGVLGNVTTKLLGLG